MRLRGPVMAIVWEQWRSVRTMVFAVTGIGLAIMWGLHLVPLHARGRWVLDYLNPALAGDTFLTVCLFLLSDTDRWELTGFRTPARQWRLPMRREHLVALCLLVRLCVAALVAWVLGQSWLLASPPRLASSCSALSLAAIGVTLLAALFAVSALANRYTGPDKGTVPALLIWFLLSAAGLYGAAVLLPEKALEPEFTVVWGVLMSVVFTCVTLVTMSRFDLPTVLARFQVKRRFSSHADYWPGRFKTPAAAQSWYERREHGLELPSLTMGGLLMAVLVVMVLNSRGIVAGPFLVDGRDPVLFRFAITLGLWGWPVLPLAAALAGLVRLSQESYAYRSNRVSYVSLMPMNPATACSIRLQSSFEWIAFTVLLLIICLIGGLMILLTMASPNEIIDELSRTCGAGPAWPLLAAIYAGAIIAGVWSLYWLAAPLLGLILWFGLLAGAGFLYALVTGDDWASGWSFEVLAVLLPALVVLLSTIRLAMYATRRRLLVPSTSALVGLFPCALLLAVASTQLLGGFWSPGRHSSPTEGALIFDALGSLLVIVVAVGLGSRSATIRRFQAYILLGLAALCCAAFAMVQTYIPSSSSEFDVSTTVALTAACFAPTLAGLLQAYWVDRLRCR